MKKKTYNIISLIILLLVITMVTVVLFPFFKHYKNPEEFKEFIDSFGSLSFLIMFLIQVFQVVVAFIPGEVMETLSGMVYGCIGGFIFSSVGIAIGVAIIFTAVRFFGRNFAERYRSLRWRDDHCHRTDPFSQLPSGGCAAAFDLRFRPEHRRRRRRALK